MSNSKTPRGIRNCNPLNIRRNHLNEWKGRRSTVTDDAFEQFIKHRYGIRAACRIIQVYVCRYHISTLRAIINRFAPPSENFTEVYYKAVYKDVGWSKVEPFNQFFMERLMCSMWRVENGVSPTPDEKQEIRQGVLMYLKDYGHEQKS